MSKTQEKNLEHFPTPLSIEQTEIILEQMKTSVCKIHPEKGLKGTGFFCKIPFPDDKNLLTVLITNHHIINEDYINTKKKITVSLYKDKNGKEENKTIYTKDKKTFSNKDYDITIIEIKQDKEDIKDFLTLDINLMNDNCENTYVGKSLYILGYPKSKQIKVSYGSLKNKLEDKEYEFNHLCSTERGSSGSPILLSENNKVIGIHTKASFPDRNYNVGSFLKPAIIDLYNKYKKKETNNDSNNIHKNKNNEISKNKKFQDDKYFNKYEKKQEKSTDDKIAIHDDKKKNNIKETNKDNNHEKKDKEAKNNIPTDNNQKKKNPIVKSEFKDDKSLNQKNKENNIKEENKDNKNKFEKDKNNKNADIKNNQNNFDELKKILTKNLAKNCSNACHNINADGKQKNYKPVVQSKNKDNNNKENEDNNKIKKSYTFNKSDSNKDENIEKKE